MSHYIFSYGIMIDAEYVKAFLEGTPISPPTEFYDSTLLNHCRVWNMAWPNSIPLGNCHFKTVTEPTTRPDVYVVFMGIEPSLHTNIHGKMFEVTENDLELWDFFEGATPEMNWYQRIDMREHIDCEAKLVDGPVWVYAPTARSLAWYAKAKSEKSGYIWRYYEQRLLAAYERLGPSALQRFHESTRTSEFQALELIRVPD